MSTLDALAQAILLELALCSDVKSSGAWMREDAPPGAPSDPDRPPPGVVLTLKGSPPSLAQHYARRYAGCRTDEQRRLVLWDALGELRSVRIARRSKVDVETRDGRLEVGRDTRPAWAVAFAYGYTERHVRRLRAEARKFAA